mmetsp:Transcript_9986/g.29430  ORF Transcript_9986/g.29430 Transcript_9986/m.29430 type:complete len:303 (+) Transcript_9986:274-1182(+)
MKAGGGVSMSAVDSLPAGPWPFESAVGVTGGEAGTSGRRSSPSMGATSAQATEPRSSTRSASTRRNAAHLPFTGCNAAARRAWRSCLRFSTSVLTPSSWDCARNWRTSWAPWVWNIWNMRMTADQYRAQAARASARPETSPGSAPSQSAKSTSRHKTPRPKWSIRVRYWVWKPPFGWVATYLKPKAKAIQADGVQYRGSPARFELRHSRLQEPDRTARPKSISAKSGLSGPPGKSTSTLCEETSLWNAMGSSAAKTPQSWKSSSRTMEQAPASGREPCWPPGRRPDTSSAGSTALCSSSLMP